MDADQREVRDLGRAIRGARDPVGPVLLSLAVLLAFGSGTAYNGVQAAPAQEEQQALPRVVSVAQRILDHPRTLWQGDDSSYNFYSGGEFRARYVRSPEKILTITTDHRGSANLVCRYRLNGELTTEAPRGLAVEEPERACNGLLRTLNAALLGP